MSKEQNCFEIQGTAVKSLGWMIDKLNKCNISDIENIFCKIATFLMKCVEIESSFTDNKYTISELEFYYCRDDHEDCYCHSYESYKKGYDHKQKQRLCWYFHGSGMDITIGDGKNIYGGILIRSVLENKELLIS
ncbi:hypothetical protein, partial [Nitratifractor sp.]|uniref:hypothetical protein n=1 Tax=Nitratifractor sp. TaxID=2268144 RepID=UPI0025DF9FFD